MLVDGNKMKLKRKKLHIITFALFHSMIFEFDSLTRTIHPLIANGNPFYNIFHPTKKRTHTQILVFVFRAFNENK